MGQKHDRTPGQGVVAENTVSDRSDESLIDVARKVRAAERRGQHRSSPRAKQLKLVLQKIDEALAEFAKAPPAPVRHAAQAAGEPQAKADPNELNMASNMSIGEFIRQLKELAQTWPQLSPTARMRALIEAANISLGRERVPPCEGKLDPKLDSVAQFLRRDWTVVVAQEQVEKPTLDLGHELQLGQVVFHEIRHAEQCFKIARLWAGQGKSKEKISEELLMPMAAVEKAFGLKLSPNSAEGKIAQDYADDLLSDAHAPIVKAVTHVVNRWNDAETIAEEIRSDPHSNHEERSLCEKLETRKLAAKEAFTTYRSLAVEEDAFAVHEAFVNQLQRGS